MLYFRQLFSRYLPTGSRRLSNDVIYDVAVEYAVMGVCIKFGDSRSNGTRDIPGDDCGLND